MFMRVVSWQSFTIFSWNSPRSYQRHSANGVYGACHGGGTRWCGWRGVAWRGVCLGAAEGELVLLLARQVHDELVRAAGLHEQDVGGVVVLLDLRAAAQAGVSGGLGLTLARPRTVLH